MLDWPVWSLALLAVLGGVAAAIAIIEFTLKPIRAFLHRHDPPVATAPDIERLEARVAQIQETVEEIKELFNHQFPVAEESSRKLVESLPADREESLRAAIEAQREHRYADAVRHLKKCIYPDMPPAERASIHNLIGNSLMYQGLALEAEPEYLEALGAAREVNDRDAEAAALGNLGLVYYDRGDFDRAERSLNEAPEIQRGIGHRLGQARQLANLGLVAEQRGDLQQAEDLLRQALAIYEEIGAGGEGPDIVREALARIEVQKRQQSQQPQQ